jgi:sporulation protein YlmC with PRC-barrel domain
VLLLSRITGQQVYAQDGHLLGRVADLTAHLGVDGGLTLIDRILVRRNRRHDILVPWSEVKSFAHNGIQLSTGGDDLVGTSIGDALAAGEILLVRDVLDTQIIDIADQRLARVADVVLAHRRDGRVEVVGVEVGFGAVLRRLGLDRLAKQLRADGVAWTDLHLTSERGHAVQLATPRAAIHLLDARGLAMLVARLDIESATEVLAAKETGTAAEIIRTSHPVIGERMLRAMSDAEAAGVVAAMPAHHAAHWRNVLATPRVLRGRHFLRSRVWPRRRHPPLEAAE